jgi:hypothetical protein
VILTRELPDSELNRTFRLTVQMFVSRCWECGMGIPASRDRVDGQLRFSTRIPLRVKTPGNPRCRRGRTSDLYLLKEADFHGFLERGKLWPKFWCL